MGLEIVTMGGWLGQLTPVTTSELKMLMGQKGDVRAATRRELKYHVLVAASGIDPGQVYALGSSKQKQGDHCVAMFQLPSIFTFWMPVDNKRWDLEDRLAIVELDQTSRNLLQ